MRYEKGHKQATRERVIGVAARRFRKDGIESTGIASLMKDAGLTHGGFYAHFASKEDLVAEAAAAALRETRVLLERSDAEDKPTTFSREKGRVTAIELLEYTRLQSVAMKSF